MVQTDGMQEMDQDEAQAASLQTPLFPLETTNQQETRRLNCIARQLEVKMHEQSAENVVN